MLGGKHNETLRAILQGTHVPLCNPHQVRNALSARCASLRQGSQPLKPGYKYKRFTRREGEVRHQRRYRDYVQMGMMVF